MNPDKVKVTIKTMANNLGVDAQELWQMFFLERLLERISLSEYKNNFIVKGGFLIASMIGISSRSTKDIDATIKAYNVTEESIQRMLNDICNVSVDDMIVFSVQSIKSIRAEDQYNGFRAIILAEFGRIEQHVKIDISTGDVMTPKEVEYKFSSIFSENSIDILSYNLETILAEKLESILSKAELTTRMRDYYDVYVLSTIYKEQLDVGLLRNALISTATYRETNEVFEVLDDLIELIENSTVLEEHWTRYKNKYAYARDIDFKDIVIRVRVLLALLDL
jgi:predicted nucleotidyltransferase component of viral defense system